MKRFRYIVWILAVLMMIGGAVNEMWAAKVTYHILTLPIDSVSRYNHHMKPAVHGHRLEAFKITVDNQSTVELPAHYKSPLAENFTYYKPEYITGHGGSAIALYDNGPNKGVLYDVKGDAVATAEGTGIDKNTAEYYVIYTYNASNGIVQLNGRENYNIGVNGKGFLSLNRGRNNRPAVMPTAKVDAEILSSGDFTYIPNPGSGITTYWSDGKNKNKRADTESKFFFIFKFEGLDPYHIVLRTSYAKDTTYIEQNDNLKPEQYVYKWYKEASMFAVGTANMYIASDEHKRFTTVWVDGNPNPTNPDSIRRHGNYHGQTSPAWGTYALLNNTSGTGYVMMGTRTVDGNGNVQGSPYYLKFTNNNNLNFGQITAAEATKSHTIEGIYPIKKVTYKIATPFYTVSASTDHEVTAVSQVSQYTVENEELDIQYVPESLQRKYCNYTGKFYSDAACTNEITKFSDVTYDAEGDGYSIYVGYELTSTIPFKAITPAASYDSTVWNKATWYELTDEGSTQTDGLKLKYDGSSAYKNDGANGEYVKASEFAFIGDPYELKVVNRKVTGDASGAAGFVTLSTHEIWDIPEDHAAVGSFLLRKYNDAGHWYWDANHPSPVAISYSTKAHTYNVATANAQTVTFNVSNLTGGDGNYLAVTVGGTNADQATVQTERIYVNGTTATFTVDIKARGDGDKQFTLSIQEKKGSDNSDINAASVVTVNQEATSFTSNTVTYSTTNATRMKVLTLPEMNFTYNVVDRAGNIAIQATVKQTIFSPIAGFASIPEVIRSPFLADETISYWETYSAGTCSDRIYETSNTDGDNIYVTYTVSHLATKSIKLDNTQQFKVKLNEEHIYFDATESKILSNPAAVENNYYNWVLEGQDPYAMKIRNVGNSGMYVKVATWGDNAALGFETGIDNGSRFIAMMSIYGGVYEVLAATGTEDYYHIGRASSTCAETKMYATGTYAHGADQLRFELAGKDAITYHLIDHAKKELLHVASFNPRLTLPAEYVSPLVKEYYYYTTKEKALTNLEEDRITEPTESMTDVYVRYIANDVVTFNNGQYMIRFLQPTAYHLEDGNDKLTSETINAMYPYCNGDGNLNIYGDDMQKEQFGGGASTRPRWVWYFDSENSDPYHVRIRSKSTTTYKSIKHPTYLTTYAVHFNQDAEGVKTIVTGGTLPGVASAMPTEYMVLGTEGNYRLMTTDSIDDGSAKMRRNVTSLEQYWKTYNMIKLHVLDISSSTDAYSDDESTWVVPADQRTTLNTRLETLGVGSGNWHSYDSYANATRWNGYNDKTNGHEKKVVEKLEHWFQTFDMGNGSFTIESAEIPPVLVLLDRHGWEIMRRPLPPASTYPVGEELGELRVYDSPLVDQYYFYSNATKASGCHKYTLRLNDSGQERDPITVNGERYSSTSLAELPPRSAKGVESGGEIQDFYVTYTVKEEYEHNYYYTLDKSTTPYTESGISQPYMVLQNGRFYKTENSGTARKDSYISKPIFEHAGKDDSENANIYDLIVSPREHGSNDKILNAEGNFLGNIFWYVKPNLNIDEEMGIPWLKVTGEATIDAAKNKLMAEYEDKMGFDPYNIQLQLKNKNDGDPDGRYLTTHMSSTRLDNGIMVGSYNASADADTTMVTIQAAGSTISAEGYDHTTMQVTNQTFMAVSDINGNMQLMPRFDHTKRLSLDKVNPWLSQLYPPEDHSKANVEDNNSMGRQTTFFICPKRYHYHIIDNNGREAMRYERSADFFPSITEHFKSPLAKDFTFYTGLAEGTTDVSDEEAWTAATGDFKRTLTKESMLADAVNLLPYAGTYEYRIGTRGVFSYKKVTVAEGDGLMDKQVIGSFAEPEVDEVDRHVYVRYEYDMDADMDADRMLQGQWYSVTLNSKDLQAQGKVVVAEGSTQGTGVNLYTGTKPATVDADDKVWQWKFLAAPTDPSSDYYVEPDPYAVQLFNRNANYTKNPSEEPSPMAVGIKVKNDAGRPDRFVVLSHPSGGYALAVAKEYTNYRYQFVSGKDMTAPDAGTPVAADTAYEAGFTYKAGAISEYAQLVLNNDVKHLFTYRVITNTNLLAITVTQTEEDAETHRFSPYLPDTAQSPLLNPEDYTYYGFASRPEGKYSVIPQTILYTLSGLYDDTVYVRYNAYDMDKTSFKVPNQKAVVDGKVARHENSIDVSMNLNHGLPYNIIWENDNIMQSTDDAAITDGGSQALSGDKQFIWYITGGDPYAFKIQHKGGKYVDGTATLSSEEDAPTFMMLKKTGYTYGILQKTGGNAMLSGYGHTTVTGSNPTKYIIFGLSIHDLIYRLIIANTGNTVDIDYRETESGTLTKKTIHGTTQRDLESVNTGDGTHYAGEKYQLGETLSWNNPVEYHTYCYDAGSVSIGDDLVLPNVFARPNCTFDFYIEGIYQHYAEANVNEGKPYEALDNKYKGLKLKKLMSDEQLIDQNVVVNIVYSFDNTLATNTGLDFVTSVGQNLWYTYETLDGTTPYLAQYTNAWGLQSKQGLETHYTNDYLWTPLGDVYGFKMYNRYMLKNTVDGEDKVMTMTAIADNQNLVLGEPSTSEKATAYPKGYEIFELISGDAAGYFRVHPVVNKSGTQYYVRRDPTDNYTKLSTMPCDWRFGLDISLLNPYYQGAGYVGGLTAAGKALYEDARDNGKITDIQKVVYNDDNIVHYTPGYYRLHNQPGVSSIDPVRYASGYLHKIELTAGADSKAIPMHFYSRKGVRAIYKGTEDDLGSGFTETAATRGEIPIDSTEIDPSTIFYFSGNTTLDGNPRSTIQTQGLYVAANANGDAGDGKGNNKNQRAVMSNDAGDAITFSIMDIGGAVLLIHDGANADVRRYLNYDQTKADSIYDLKYYHNAPTDDAKWCMQPVQKEATAGDGEMPLRLNTNNGGDGYYYATFYAPFDVLLPSDGGGKTYNAYTCSQWYNDAVHPTPVPAVSTYAEGKFVPAGTPVIIRVKDESGELTLTLPSTAPSASLSCVFRGQYLEQLLEADAAHDVYTLGVPMISDIESYNRTTGDITAPLPDFAASGVGFYINATRNKEDDPLQALWHRNNRYVLHNRIYYRAGDKAGAPEHKSGTEYVPVIFGDEDQDQPEDQQASTNLTGLSQKILYNGQLYILHDGKVYTITGALVK